MPVFAVNFHQALRHMLSVGHKLACLNQHIACLNTANAAKIFNLFN